MTPREECDHLALIMSEALAETVVRVHFSVVSLTLGNKSLMSSCEQGLLSHTRPHIGPGMHIQVSTAEISGCLNKGEHSPPTLWDVVSTFLFAEHDSLSPQGFQTQTGGMTTELQKCQIRTANSCSSPRTSTFCILDNLNIKWAIAPKDALSRLPAST